MCVRVRAPWHRERRHLARGRTSGCTTGANSANPTPTVKPVTMLPPLKASSSSATLDLPPNRVASGLNATGWHEFQRGTVHGCARAQTTTSEPRCQPTSHDAAPSYWKLVLLVQCDMCNAWFKPDGLIRYRCLVGADPQRMPN